MSHVTRHTSHVTRHTSHVTRPTSHVTRHTSHVTRHTSHATPVLTAHSCSHATAALEGSDLSSGGSVHLQSCVMRHASHVTRHASSITRHTSPITHHPSHVTPYDISAYIQGSISDSTLVVHETRQNKGPAALHVMCCMLHVAYKGFTPLDIHTLAHLQHSPVLVPHVHDGRHCSHSLQ